MADIVTDLTMIGRRMSSHQAIDSHVEPRSFNSDLDADTQATGQLRATMTSSTDWEAVVHLYYISFDGYLKYATCRPEDGTPTLVGDDDCFMVFDAWMASASGLPVRPDGDINFTKAAVPGDVVSRIQRLQNTVPLTNLFCPRGYRLTVNSAFFSYYYNNAADAQPPIWYGHTTQSDISRPVLPPPYLLSNIGHAGLYPDHTRIHEYGRALNLKVDRPFGRSTLVEGGSWFPLWYQPVTRTGAPEVRVTCQFDLLPF